MPISFRYMRTGSFVGARSRSTSIRTWVAASVSSPGTSIVSMPTAVRCSWIWVRTSSICSGVKSSTGSDSSRSSEVTKPRSRPRATSCSLTSSRLGRSRSGSRAGTLIRTPGGCSPRRVQCTERVTTSTPAPGGGAGADRPPPRAPGRARRSRGRRSGSASAARVRRASLRPLSRNSSSRGPPRSRTPGSGRPRAARPPAPPPGRRASVLAAGERGHVAARVAERDEEPAVRGVAEVVLGQRRPAVLPWVSAPRAISRSHLALRAFGGGPPADRAGDLLRACPTSRCWSDCSTETSLTPARSATSPAYSDRRTGILQAVEEGQRLGHRRGLPLDRGQVVPADRSRRTMYSTSGRARGRGLRGRPRRRASPRTPPGRARRA